LGVADAMKTLQLVAIVAIILAIYAFGFWTCWRADKAARGKAATLDRRTEAARRTA